MDPSADADALAEVPADSLFNAIAEEREARAAELLAGPHAERLLGFRAASLCTPLMLAARLKSPKLLDQMLGFGPRAVRASARSQAGWTAADYAEHHTGAASLVEQLRAFEAAELAELAEMAKAAKDEEVRRCVVCGESVKRRPRLLVLADRYFKGEESNLMVDRFFREHYAVFLQLMQPELHTVNDQRRLNKELSESLAVVEAFERLANLSGGEAGATSWHVVDLCCGRSLTAAILALRHPSLLVTTADRLPAIDLPHYAEAGIKGIFYEQLDVLSPDFTETIQRITRGAGERQTALIGMHLCGRLSECAIEAFVSVEGINICVLSPCCLPGLEDAPSVLRPLYRTRSRNSQEQFAAWEAHLESQLRQEPSVQVERRIVEDIISPRRTVITAVKRPAS